MRAFFDDHRIKALYLARVRAHARADEIVQGTYWTNGKGCGVGCTIEGDDLQKYETELGIPLIVAAWEDEIFETLTLADAKDFPLRVLEAIPVGADLAMVGPRMLLWILGDPVHGVTQGMPEAPARAIEAVVALYAAWSAGTLPSVDAWRAAADAVAEVRRGHEVWDILVSESCELAHFAAQDGEIAARWAGRPEFARPFLPSSLVYLAEYGFRRETLTKRRAYVRRARDHFLSLLRQAPVPALPTSDFARVGEVVPA